MLKKIIFLVVLLCVSIYGAVLFFSPKGLANIEETAYIGSIYEGNFVWGGAMNLAWNELSENIIKQREIKIATTDPVGAHMVRSFNTQFFTKDDLDAKSYYIKSGFGQKTVNLVNKESREKFPDKSFDDLTLELTDIDFLAYAYFLKQVEYPDQFDEGDVSFLGHNVKGFVARSSEQRENVIVKKYKNKDEFLINLKLKDETDELFVLKGFQDHLPEQIVDYINDFDTTSGKSMESIDIFRMPNVSLNLNRQYEELINHFFLNTGFEDYFIAEMFENIRFDLDNKGARVENEAVISGVFGMSPGSVIKQKPRYFILDKPFWIVMKRSNSNSPYFILQVNNTNIMQK